MPLSSSVHNLARHQRTDVRADRHVIKHQISNLLNCLLTCYLLTFWCRCIAGPWIIFTFTHKTGLVRNISRSNNAIVNGELMPHRHIVQLISVAAIYQLNWNKFILNCEKEKKISFLFTSHFYARLPQRPGLHPMPPSIVMMVVNSRSPNLDLIDLRARLLFTWVTHYSPASIIPQDNE